MKCCQTGCENEATVHLTEIVEGQMKKIDLCEDCAKDKGVTDPQGFALADLLLGLGASSEIEAAGGGELVCDECGFAHADFKKSGRLGCPACYQTFAGPLEGMVKQMHKGTEHVGKVPKALQQVKRATQQREKLQQRLARAVEEENYELAAQLRDEIKELEQESAA
ncbi:MAG: excinuclease ABC subunit B [Verrucomicrobiales bacterium]|nr:excinuclease ABC subunit B [Verrucomicrobiales bacterium]|tara:strand:+ start:287 stop:784 length:498 start_codon:yes stop_codon:yes gene_type:complete